MEYQKNGILKKWNIKKMEYQKNRMMYRKGQSEPWIMFLEDKVF